MSETNAKPPIAPGSGTLATPPAVTIPLPPLAVPHVIGRVTDPQRASLVA